MNTPATSDDFWSFLWYVHSSLQGQTDTFFLFLSFLLYYHRHQCPTHLNHIISYHPLTHVAIYHSYLLESESTLSYYSSCNKLQTDASLWLRNQIACASPASGSQVYTLQLEICTSLNTNTWCSFFIFSELKTFMLKLTVDSLIVIARLLNTRTVTDLHCEVLWRRLDCSAIGNSTAGTSCNESGPPWTHIHWDWRQSVRLTLWVGSTHCPPASGKPLLYVCTTMCMRATCKCMCWLSSDLQLTVTTVLWTYM